MKMTRRKAALLLGQTLMVAPILAVESSASRSDLLQNADAAPTHHDEHPLAPVYIALWFDTEDYILPASDDAAKRIVDLLTAQGIRATFKIVGEKARALERRQRTDVIASLSSQEIGYHSNTHSQHPTVAEYESVLDWESGGKEFDRRERAGFDDVARIFGKSPTCYGQPGYSWAPQVFPTLKKWGVNVYLDDGQQVQLGGKPFWYGGLLNIFNIQAGQQLEPNSQWSNLTEAKASFKALYAQMSSQSPGGLISVYFHPTEFVSSEFWDAVNFGNGANPPRSEWKFQPEKSPAQREQAFQYLEGLVTYMKSFPGARFVTASEADGLYRDSAQGRVFGTQDLAEIAGQVNRNITFQVHKDYVLTASEAFMVLNSYVVRFAGQRASGEVKLEGTPYGPSSPAYGVATRRGNLEIVWSQFSRACIDIQGFLETNRAIPNAAWFGSTAVTPESYLLALADVAKSLILKSKQPDSVNILPAELAAAQWVAKDSPELWPWPIFPPAFHSSHLMELARLQAWTIKPAVLKL
jgi:hypothetical protein